MTRYEIKPSRPSRVRETAPVHDSESMDPAHATGPAHAVYEVTMADRGRLVLPAEVRERLNIKEGDRLMLVAEADGSLRLLTFDAYIARLRGAFKHLAAGRMLSDELIAERRLEAAVEDRKASEFLERYGRKDSRDKGKG
jgi:AbrB family looped-hinge helix DNA binding protein